MKLVLALAIAILMTLFTVSVTTANPKTETCTRSLGIFNVNVFAMATYDVFERPNGLLEFRWVDVLNADAYLSLITTATRTVNSNATGTKSNGDRTLNISGFVTYDVGMWTPFGFVPITQNTVTHSCSRNI